jgi:hypothetical protein
MTLGGMENRNSYFCYTECPWFLYVYLLSIVPLRVILLNVGEPLQIVPTLKVKRFNDFSIASDLILQIFYKLLHFIDSSLIGILKMKERPARPAPIKLFTPVISSAV